MVHVNQGHDVFLRTAASPNAGTLYSDQRKNFFCWMGFNVMSRIEILYRYVLIGIHFSEFEIRKMYIYIFIKGCVFALYGTNMITVIIFRGN